jgi:tetratricopeptide (TPR) repeat protein
MSESNLLEFTHSLIATGDLQAAEKSLRARLRIPPAPEGAHLLMIDLLTRMGKYSEAMQFVSEHPDDAEIFIKLRDYFIGERMNDSALSLISKSRFPDPGVEHINESIRKQISGDLQAAIASCNNALRFNNNDASAYNQLGRVLFNSGHPPQSQSAFEKAIALKPEFAEAWHNLGHVLRAQKKLEEAEKAYARSVELAPCYRSALLNLGVVKFALDKNKEGLINFTRLIELDPQNVEAQTNAGIGEFILRNFEKAKIHFRTAIELDPRNDAAMQHLATVFAEELDFESAIEYFRKSLVINPHSSDVWTQIIEVYERSNRQNDAKQALTEASRILPVDANIQYVSAKLALRNNQIEQSVSIFKKIDSRLLHPRFLQAYHFEFATALDQAHEYTQAYDNFEIANAAAARNVRANQTDFSALDRYMDATEEWLQGGAHVAQYEKDEDLGADLCFMLGFQHSNTALLDAALAAHPKIKTLDECTAFERIAFSIDQQFGGYPFGMSVVDATQRQSLREEYRNLLEREGIKSEKDGVILDKMPIRTIHAACIHRLFPRAKFLFALRHPCDVILDNYMQNYAANEVSVHFNSLAECTRIYERVMRIWKTSSDLMPIPVHYVRHEQLMSDPQRSFQEICRFLDLPWVENMAVHQNIMKDASIAHRPLSHWMHYRTQFDPQLAKLKPYADFFSYSLD